MACKQPFRCSQASKSSLCQTYIYASKCILGLYTSIYSAKTSLCLCLLDIALLLVVELLLTTDHAGAKCLKAVFAASAANAEMQSAEHHCNLNPHLNVAALHLVPVSYVMCAL